MRTVVGLFDRFEDAQQVARALIDAGIQRDNISLIANDAKGEYSKYLPGERGETAENVGSGAVAGAGIGATVGGIAGLLAGLGALAIPGIGPVIAAGPIAAALAGAGIGAAAGGLLGALTQMGIPEEHAKLYSEGVRHGGTLVLASVDDTRTDQVVDIMNRFNPVDINERSQMWSTDRSAGFEERDLQQARNEQQNIPVTGDWDEATFPVIEEDIHIGKREVDEGNVRVNPVTSERPVDEEIRLRNERVNVERRPVDREATDADFDTFKEGSMEFKESREEPVVEKRSRVVEEVHVNKDVEDEIHTVHDSVRRQDVEVERDSRRQAGMGSSDWMRYEPMYRQDYQTRYGSTGRDFNYYMPAYRYGYDLRSNPSYGGYDWSRVEPEARRDWERRGGQGAWEDVKDAVRHAWESVRR
jgi:uncharacterized protein (TIGR02271 family)